MNSTATRVCRRRASVWLTVLILLGLGTASVGGPFSHRSIQFTQLTGEKFYGNWEGDEFESRFSTEAGYTFVCKGQNYGPPFEYAVLNSRGDFTGSGKLVGIDPPPPDSDPSLAWRGIFFYSNDSQNLLDYCVFDNATVGVRGLAGSSATISNTSFNNSGIGVTTNNGGHLVFGGDFS